MNSQQEYWSNPKDIPNKPESYVKEELNKRSSYLFKLMQKYIHKKDNILEIGCNAGRNLNYLYKKGFTKLFGIEINENAVKLMEKTYPEMFKKASITINSLEDTIPFIKDNCFDVVISLAVLMHLPYKSNYLFKDIARITKKYLFIIEDERPEILGNRHFPRDYQNIFQKYGFYEINSGKCEDDLKNYTWRIFKKC